MVQGFNYMLHKLIQKSVLNPEKRNTLNKLIYSFCIILLVITLPQVIKIWIEKSASGVSILTWIAYLLIALLWLVYGVVHKEKPLVILNSIMIFLIGLIVYGVFIYG